MITLLNLILFLCIVAVVIVFVIIMTVFNNFYIVGYMLALAIYMYMHVGTTTVMSILYPCQTGV